MLKFDIGACTLTEIDDDGFMSHQYDAEGETNAGVAAYEGHHFLGFMGKPMDPVTDASGQPDATKALQLLFAMEEGKGHSWPMEDPRVVPNLPSLKNGETLHYGCAGNFTRMKADGSIVSFTTAAGGDPSGSSIYQSIGAADALGNLEFNRIAPWGTEHFGEMGYDLLLKSGARIRGGSLGGLPGPLDAIDSYWKIDAAMVRIIGAAVALGPAGGEAEPTIKGTQLLAYLAAFQTALVAAIATGVAGAAAGDGGHAALTAMGTAVAAIPPALPAMLASVTVA